MPTINAGDLVTVNHPVAGVVTGRVMVGQLDTFWLVVDTSYHFCHVSMVIARYQTIAA